MSQTPLIARRSLIASGAALGGAALAAVTAPRWLKPVTAPSRSASVAMRSPGPLAPVPAQPKITDPIEREALAALDRVGRRVPHHDRLAIVDFSAPSSKPRMHVLDVASGRRMDFLVAHGSGSDPAHTGILQRFSNVPDSNASSQGAFLTADYYVGKHGRSQRLIGLDPTNNNALERAIVVHGAWYANADMIPTHGKLGRSQGCFAVGERELAQVFAHLGQGRMIYSAKV
jgi:hypothetical protein